MTTSSSPVSSLLSNAILLRSIFLSKFFATDPCEMVSLGFQDSRTTQAIIAMTRRLVALYAVSRILSNHRTSTSPETLPLEDTALPRKPACESTRCSQSDEQNIEYTPSQRLAMRRVLDVAGWKTLKNSMVKTQG